MNRSKVKFWNSLGTRFALFFSVLNIMAILMVGYLVYQQAASVITAHSQERMQYTANLAVKSFSSLLSEIANDIALTTNNPALANYVNSTTKPSNDDIEALFTAILANKPNYFQIRLLDVKNKGKEIIRFDKIASEVVRTADHQLQFKGDRKYYQEAIKVAKGEYYYSDINLNEEYGEISTPFIPTLRAVGQVFDKQQTLRSLLVINIDLSAFYEELNQIMGPDFYLVLVNEKGDYLFAQDMDICFGTQRNSGNSFFSDYGQTIETLPGDQNIGFIDDISGDSFLYHLETINYSSDQKIFLINLQKDDLLLRSAYLVRNDSLKLVLLVCIISAIISLLFAKAFSSNINQITNAVVSYEEDGDHNPPPVLPQTRKDELGVLARSFARMRDKIDQQFGALKSALNREQQAIKERDQFLQNMSHELRTPLNAILGLIKLLNKNQPTKDQEPIIHSMERSALNLSGLVHDVLDHQKLTEGAVELNLQPSNIHGLLKDIHAGYRYEAISKGLNFILDIPDTLGKSTYLTDQLRLSQIITNLVVNAIKFTDQGTVRLEATMVTDTEPYLRVSVKDSGRGIKPENLRKIKDRFFQEPTLSNAGESGYGLGLSIVKQLVDLFNGTLEVSSEIGQGSNFTVFLPLIPSEMVDTKASVKNSENRLPQLNKTYHVLHIDDDPSTLLMVSHILEIPMVSVMSASTFSEADALMKENSFDLIISDLMLHRNTIDPMLVQIGNSSPTPILLLSAFEPSRMKEISAYYLQKPFEQLDLKNLAVMLLGRQEYDYPYLEHIYKQYDYQPQKINNFLSILQEEFNSYVTRFEKVFETRDLKEWEAILHKLTTHIKSLRLEKLSAAIPESPIELNEESSRIISNSLLYCLCVLRHERILRHIWR